jgi:hypothetical protein
MRVSSLIDKNLKQWNNALITSIFLLEEVSAITNISLSLFLPRDRLIWRCTKNGDFTVRSAYHLGMERQVRQQLGCSGAKKEGEVWKTCWSMRVPNAIKMFLWRACHNLLPTKVNLLKRGICDNSFCPICLSENETVEHIIWECPMANDVWGEAPIKLQKSTYLGGNFSQIFTDVISWCIKEEVELFAIIARRIWHRRNEVVHGGILMHPVQIVRGAVASLDDFKRVNQRGGVQAEAPETSAMEN